MAKKNLKSNGTPIDVSYIGNINFKKESYDNFSGHEMILLESLKNPVTLSISRDVTCILTDYKYYDDIFNDIRTTNVGTINSNISALASNDFTSYEDLSAVAELGNSSGALSSTDVIGISDTLDDGDSELRDNTNYSFNSTVEFNNNYWVDADNILSSVNSPLLDDSHYFYFYFIDQSVCNIKKSDDSGEKFLTYSTATSSLSFTNTEDVIHSRFFYSYNSESNQIMIITEDGSLGIDFDGNITVTNLSSATLSSDITNNILNVDNKNNLDSSESVLNSFLPKYKNKNNIANQSFVDNSHIITHNFKSNKSQNSNFITLKNNVSNDGEYSLLNPSASVAHRDYTTINTGIRGESGSTNIIMGYNTTQFKVDFIPDKRTYFNIPYELNEYDQININESKLVHNGAIGGTSPLNSDKVYKKLYEYSDFKNTGSTVDVDNGQYLCSWLWYNPLRPTNSIWLDRYYNPDKTTRLDALSVQGWNTIKDLESFSRVNTLSVSSYAQYYDEFDKELGVFDVESKLTFQPNVLYAYDRIGKETSKKLNDENVNDLIGISNDQVMDFSNVIEISPKDTLNDEEFTMNIVLSDFNLNTFKGNRIFGNKNMSLTVDRKFSPYTATVDDDTLYFYDYDYNPITNINLSSTISDVIFTDDYNTIYVELTGGEIYTIENLDFITNVTTALTSFNILDIKYSDNLLHYIDNSGNYFSFNPTSEISNPSGSGSSSDDLILVYDDNFSSYAGDYVDYSDNGNAYILSSNAIFYNDVSTPIISGDTITDIYVDKSDIIYALKDDALFKIDNSFLTETLTSINISANNTLRNIRYGRYIRDGEIKEYLDVIDSDNISSYSVYRYDKDLNLIDTITPDLSGSIIKDTSLYSSKYSDNRLELDITLYNIFNYIQRGKIRLEIPKRFIEQDDTCVLNAVFSNKFGSINVYCNGELIKIYKFDANKYYFSNTLRDTKIFLGSSNFNGETTIDDKLLSSDNDMISGNYTIKEFSIYGTYLNYFDVINYNRIYRNTDGNSLILPIKTRSYIEEISGMYIQNKNLRKSEYGSISLRGSDLTNTMQTDVKNRIDKLFEDTFVNLRVDETEIL